MLQWNRVIGLLNNKICYSEEPGTCLELSAAY